MTYINFQLFPRSQGISKELQAIIDCFIQIENKISSNIYTLNSNEVLKELEAPLSKIGYFVETGKRKEETINVPVLFGINNQIDKSFKADALSTDGKIVIEVEAGRATANNQFLKDIFQACMMVKVEHLVIAVRNTYRNQNDFKKIYTFLDTLYTSGRLKLPLNGILIIGY